MRKPYAEWKVGEDTYKLKLTTGDIIKLEEQFKTNLINIIDMGGGNIPALSIMLKVTHQAMNKFHHGIKLQDVYSKFDEYCEEGGSQMSYMSEVFLPIYQVSGFLSPAQAEEMSESLEEANEQM